MADNFQPFLPLSPAVLHILVALSREELHGYGIMQEVARASGHQVKLGPGTLYDNLEKLLDAGIVEESSHAPAHSDPRRRYYRLTGFGRRLLSAEVARLQSVLRAARQNLKPRLGRA
jgi:DNA-binding PadR family transcriptional regulator